MLTINAKYNRYCYLNFFCFIREEEIFAMLNINHNTNAQNKDPVFCHYHKPEIHEYYSYGTPFIQEYSMNWGWGISYDNGWYSTTGSWTSGGYSFDYGKMMLADFSEIQ